MNFCKSRREGIHLISGILLLLAFSFSLGFSGQQDVSEYKKRLAGISEQIDQLKLRLNEEEKKESTFLSELDRIGFHKNLIRKEISLYTMQLGNTNRELSSIQRRIPRLKSKLDDEKESIEKILVAMYKFGKVNPFQFMLQAEDMGTLVSESKNLTLLVQYQNNVISSYVIRCLCSGIRKRTRREKKGKFKFNLEN